MTESDTDLVVEYEDRQGACSHVEGEDRSMSDSNTVNQDQDSFSILDGDSLLDGEGPQMDLPPLFVHVTCSVNVKSCHGSMPVQTLPTCLGKSCPAITTGTPKTFTYFAYILLRDWKDFDFTSVIDRFLPTAALFGFHCICLFSVDGRTSRILSVK